ncbi:MAG: lipid-binding SYLF domain-containing protein [Vicinamibacterales bacterium]
MRTPLTATPYQHSSRGLSLALGALAVLFLLLPQTVTAQHTDETRRLAEAIEVLTSLTSTPDEAIPTSILDEAEAIVVIPTLVKGGFVIGAEHGSGVMSVRDRTTGTWGAPGFVKMTGGSVGWQIGLSSTDLVLVVTNQDGVDDLLASEFTLGANASVAAGPVGRSAEASTDARAGAKILAYSRSRGLFAGATIEGSSLRSDDDANRRFYGMPLEMRAIVRGTGMPEVPAAGIEWQQALARMVGAAGH